MKNEAKQDALQLYPQVGSPQGQVHLLLVSVMRLDNGFKNSKATIKIENDCFLS
jgi:hypothetical protein